MRPRERDGKRGLSGVYDIRPLVFSLTGFDFTSTNVPTTGVTAADVKDEVVQLAVAFFEQTLPR